MRRYFIILVFAICILPVSVSSQNVLDGLYPKEHVSNRKPVPFPYIREADVMWAKKVWRVIDLREKLNLPLYYPTKQMDDRYSLIDLLIYGIQYEGLTAYSAKSDDEFKVQLSIEQVQTEMGAVADTQMVRDPETGIEQQKVIAGLIRSTEVKQVLLKEIWFFDRNYSRLDVRIIGLCPIRELVRSNGDVDQIVKKKVFWIYFPQVRDLFARYEVFNAKNDSQRRTFDDIFMKRYFGSYIVQETNVYDNRIIENYAVGLESMLESERIKREIFTFEHDLWEF